MKMINFCLQLAMLKNRKNHHKFYFLGRVVKRHLMSSYKFNQHVTDYLVSGLVIVSPPQPYRLSGSPMLRYTSMSSSYRHIRQSLTGLNKKQMNIFQVVTLMVVAHYMHIV